MENYIGRLLDSRYEILDVIGTGGMAVVYRALDHRLNRLVAVKILKDELSRNQEFRRRFHAESQAVAMLSHPNIVSVYDVSRSGDADYIVMELIEGITLKQYLEKKLNLNWRETLHFSMQIAKALEHAHGRGIVHRDIKPHNIMILKDGSIKVADFGIARVGSAQNTLTREALGSVHYISPEQAKGARVDNRSDLYSLGVVMYEMLTGRTPYDGETPVSVAIQHINGTARRPSELMPGIPIGLEQIVMRAMSANADSRYSSATEMLRDMEEFRKNPAMTFPLVTVQAEPVRQAQRQGMTRTEAERYAAARAAKNPDGRTAEERRAERARRERELAEQKRRKTLTIAIVVAAAVLVILLVVLIVALAGGSDEPSERESTSDMENGEIEVEQFVGMRLEDINPDDYPDLLVDVENVKTEYSDEYEEGYVMAQSPKAGDMVKRGRTVTLTVSKGAEEQEMPPLKDATEAEAMKALEELKLGLKITVKDENSNDVKQGSVVRTEPAAGEKLKKGQEVILYISLGENKMPDLKNDTRSNAETRLRALDIGLDIIFLEEKSDEVEEGKVIRTVPAAGTQLKENDDVTVYISTGDGKVMVPPVIGFTKMEAISLLKDAKLMYEVREMYDPTVESGKVISQSEKPNTKVEKGTVVVIDVSMGPEPTQEPSTEPSTEPSSSSEEDQPAPNSETP